MRGSRASRRCLADSGVSLPTDRSAACGGCNRQGRQRQEGAVPGAVGHGQRRRQDHGRRQLEGARHRARRFVRLQHAGVRHAGAADPGAHHRRACDLRRDAFGAATGRQGYVLGRRARICSGSGAGRGCGRRRRRLHRNPSRSRSCAVRRPQHGAVARFRRLAADADGLRRGCQESARKNVAR